MKKNKFTERQIIRAITSNQSGRSVEGLSRELGITAGTFYTWRKKYGGMEVWRYGSFTNEATIATGRKKQQA